MPSTIEGRENALEESALRKCHEALQGVADFRLPPALDRRLLWLSENKEQLSNAEKEELLALVAVAEERTVEKLQAMSQRSPNS